MKKITVNVSKTTDGYSASIDLLPGWAIATEGDFSAFQKELQESVNIFIKWAKKDGDSYPVVFNGDYQFEYKFDVESLLWHYNGIISRAALSRISGINERQLGHYICGRSHPKPDQALKIVNALHRLGSELLSVSI
jgi:hypothetical protein